MTMQKTRVLARRACLPSEIGETVWRTQIKGGPTITALAAQMNDALS